MKISKETLALLKNFKEINPGIVIREGKSVRTVSENENILAIANVQEFFPTEVALADLTRFIRAIDLFEESPDIEFGESNLNIKLDNTNLNYLYASTNVIKHLLEKEEDGNIIKTNIYDLTLDNNYKYPVSIHLTKDQITALTKTAQVLSVPYLCFDFEDNEQMVNISVRNLTDSLTSFSMKVPYNKTVDYLVTGSLVFKISNIMLLEGSYVINIHSNAKNNTTFFKNTGVDLTYIISAEEVSNLNLN